MRRGVYSLFLLIILAFSGNSLLGQVSTKGKDFWYGYLNNSGSIGGNPIYTFVSSSSNATITGTITISGLSWTQNFTVAPNSTAQITMPSMPGGVEPNGDENTYNLAVHLTACDSVTVYTMTDVQQGGASSGSATIVYPTSALRSKYMTINYDNPYGLFDKGSEFLIVPTQNNTTVQITPTVTTTGGHVAGVPYNVTLNQGQTYLVTEDVSDSSLIGTTVIGTSTGTCKPFAVFTGSKWAEVGNCGNADELLEQLAPMATMGKNYILTPLKQRTETIYRIVAIQNATSFTINGGTPVTLNAGQYYQFQNNVASYVSSNNPIEIMQYARGGLCNTSNIGDPFTILMYPTNQFLKKITFSAFPISLITQFWVNIVVKTSSVATTTLDGTNISSSFASVPSNASYSYARLSLTPGDHTLINSTGALAYIYGYGTPRGFGYAAGASLNVNNSFTTSANHNISCLNYTISFNAIPDANATSYQWDFGDGSVVATGMNTSHSYNSSGSYSVVLTKYRSSGCNITYKKQISVLPPVKIAQNDTLVCKGSEIPLTASTNGLPIYSINSCGDTTSIDTLQYNNITWSTGGTGDSINVTINSDTTIYAYGLDTGITCNSVDSIKIKVDQPVAKFSFTNVCNGDSMYFNDNSTPNLGGSVDAWQWTFGSLGNSSLQNPAYLFPGDGSFNVKLATTDSLGCQEDTTIEVTIYPVPTADFSFTNVCDGDSMVFADNSSIAGGGTINNWNWNFGDGTGTSTQQNPDYTYSNAGQDSVQLIVKTSNNCADTIKKQVTVYPNPTANFNADTACYGVATLFTDSSTVASGNIATWDWNFGDGTGTSTQQNPAYTYANEGSYQVQLTVETNHNCIDSITKTVVVNPLPDPNFTGTNLSGCTPWCVNLTDSSSISSGSIVNWEWNVGNDSDLTGSSLIHCYSNSSFNVNTYPISLTVTSNKGCEATITKNNFVSIYPRPKAAFTMNPNPGDIYHNKIHFIDQSMGADSWAWDFGNGIGVSNEQSPLFVYGDTGTYLINLKVTNQWNCSDSTSEMLRINPVFAFFIPNAFSPNGDGVNDTFYPKGFGIKAMTMYIFNRWGNLIYSKKSLNSQWNGTYENKLVPPGVYVYKIIVLDEKGNSHIYTGSVTVIR